MNQGKIHHHKDLRVWRAAIDLAKDVYRFTAMMPPIEQYGLTAQLRRAATSIPANIAEGAARGSSRDFARFLAIAQGSVAELETHLILAKELHGIEPQPSLNAKLIAVRMMLIKLRAALVARV